MIEIKIPRELDRYEPKFIGPLTLRQTIGVVFAGGVCIAIFKFLKPITGMAFCEFLSIVPASVAVAFGWLKPYGMKFEKFLMSIFVNSVLAPVKRRYITENRFDEALEKLRKEDETEVFDDTTEELLGELCEKYSAEIERLESAKTAKKKKYKQSPLAIK